jgi:hypothetical protein
MSGNDTVLQNDMLAEMRERLIAKSLEKSSAGILRKAAPAAADAFSQPTPVQHQQELAAPAPRRTTKSIFDPAAASPTATPAAAATNVEQPVAAPPALPVAAQAAMPAVPVQATAPTHVQPAATTASAAKPNAYVRPAPRRYSVGVYTAVCVLATFLGVGTVYNANKKFAGEMYGSEQMQTAANAFAEGKNYATFDLNINIRDMRDKHIAQMTKTPDVAILGASHWQEAHEKLVTNQDFYNSHIHRDYWEDMFAMVNIWERHGKLPKKIIISVRDNLFMPISARKDFLWEPGIPYWRAQADIMGIEKEPWWRSYPWQRLSERFSMIMLFNNVTRWLNAEEKPRVTTAENFKSLDVLLPGGSIVWSNDHATFFSQERSKRESLDFAKVKIKNPPVVERRGVENFEKLLTYLKNKGVTIYFVEPPFNPIFWDAVQNTAYSRTLEKFVAMTDDIAKRHGIEQLGSFNPNKVGCTADNYIDAEHANAKCLSKIFDQFMALDAEKTKSK